MQFYAFKLHYLQLLSHLEHAAVYNTSKKPSEHLQVVETRNLFSSLLQAVHLSAVFAEVQVLHE